MVAATLSFGMAMAPGQVGADVVTGTAPPGQPEVVATGLDNPRKLTIGPDGALYVAEGGKGGEGPPCVTGPEGATCYGPSGAISRIAGGVRTRVLEGLASLAGEGGTGAAGPVDVSLSGGRLHVLMQHLAGPNGESASGDAGPELGQIVSAAPGSARADWRIGPDFPAFEVANDPGGEPPALEPGGEPALNSNPYAFVPYGNGYAVADAGGNDLLFVDADGNISLLAVFPTQQTTIPAGAMGPGQPPTDMVVDVQSVPTSVAVGPDGALYVGELAGLSPGLARVWKVVPGEAPVLVAGGFNPISDLAFDRQGRLLVLELTSGFGPMGPAPGALIRIEPNGARTTLASQGLVMPGGIAVGSDGSIYLTNFGIFASGGPPAGPPAGMVMRIPAPSGNPYRFAADDGGVFSFGGAPFYGSLGDVRLGHPVVDLESHPLRPGYWLTTANGSVHSFGDAGFYGHTEDLPLNQPIVAMEATPDGRGYWLVASDGGIFSYGNATFFGSTGAIALSQPIVSMAATPDGSGYWLFAADGGVFTFGSAGFHGSTGGMRLNQPVVAGAATPDGRGYWLVASDGGVFTFGSAGYFGSTGDIRLKSPIVSITPTEDGQGYALVAADGGVFNFGSSTFHGSTGDIRLNRPIVDSDRG